MVSCTSTSLAGLRAGPPLPIQPQDNKIPEQVLKKDYIEPVMPIVNVLNTDGDRIKPGDVDNQVKIPEVVADKDVDPIVRPDSKKIDVGVAETVKPDIPADVKVPDLNPVVVVTPQAKENTIQQSFKAIPDKIKKQEVTKPNPLLSITKAEDITTKSILKELGKPTTKASPEETKIKVVKETPVVVSDVGKKDAPKVDVPKIDEPKIDALKIDAPKIEGANSKTLISPKTTFPPPAKKIVLTDSGMAKDKKLEKVAPVAKPVPVSINAESTIKEDTTVAQKKPLQGDNTPRTEEVAKKQELPITELVEPVRMNRSEGNYKLQREILSKDKFL